MKTCNVCEQTKPIDDFYKRPKCRDGYANQCRKCEIARQGVYTSRAEVRERRNELARARGRSSDAIRKQRLWTWHRLTLEDYERILAEQGGVCAICRRPESATSKGKIRNLAVDHDHACCDSDRSCGQCVRGLLCNRCNPMLGYAEDNLETLLAAVEYLTHRQSLPVR